MLGQRGSRGAEAIGVLIVVFLAAALGLCVGGCATSTAGGDTNGALDGGDGGSDDGRTDGDGTLVPGDATDGGTDSGGDTGGGDTDGGSGQSGLLTAGDVDDNLNFGFFASWISSRLQDQESRLPAVSLADRISLRIADGAGAPASNARVVIREQGSQNTLVEAVAGTDGVFRFFPALDSGANQVNAQQTAVYVVEVSSPDGGEAQTVTIDAAALDDTRTVDIALDGAGPGLPDALDVALVIDTTGSMGDELEYLKTEFTAIIAGVGERFPGVDMRFALILYRDIGDLYVVRTFDFTDSVDTMQSQLEAQRSEGGGDWPEAMEQALEHAVDLSWRTGNVGRLTFLVADAPPHDPNMQAALDQSYRARLAGIRICPLAASGVDPDCEYIMRLFAVMTHGRYLFLTDDSGVGLPHAEPSVPCYVVTRLDSLMIRVIASELAGERVEPDPSEIIRTVGDYQNGVCGSQTPDEQTH